MYASENEFAKRFLEETGPLLYLTQHVERVNLDIEVASNLINLIRRNKLNVTELRRLKSKLSLTVLKCVRRQYCDRQL